MPSERATRGASHITITLFIYEDTVVDNFHQLQRKPSHNAKEAAWWHQVH